MDKGKFRARTQYKAARGKLVEAANQTGQAR